METEKPSECWAIYYKSTSTCLSLLRSRVRVSVSPGDQLPFPQFHPTSTLYSPLQFHIIHSYYFHNSISKKYRLSVIYLTRCSWAELRALDLSRRDGLVLGNNGNIDRYLMVGELPAGSWLGLMALYVDPFIATSFHYWRHSKPKHICIVLSPTPSFKLTNKLPDKFTSNTLASTPRYGNDN